MRVVIVAQKPEKLLLLRSFCYKRGTGWVPAKTRFLPARLAE